ncbi:MAG TPA: METTL5 family protein [Methanoregulaceae archaeon]|nr:METTL5 family protein [Methanoregulaceae archaeon]
MRLKQLEMALQQVEGFADPSARREQYATPAPLAARLLYHAFMQGDIKDMSVQDLGCGTGILSIGASLLGAASVKGVDIDRHAVDTARKNAESFRVDPEFITGDIRDLEVRAQLGSCNTVVMNPPFGAQAAHADRPFIDAALELGEVVYSIFNRGSRQFVEEYIRGRGTIKEVVGVAFPLKRTFSFHTKEVREILVEVLVMRRIQS